MIATSRPILIVEDDPDACDWMTRMLGKFGYDAQCVDSLSGAVTKLGISPCCVILDLHLPDGSGVNLLRHIRALDLQMKVAVIIGAPDDVLAVDAAVLKPDALFVKPVDPSELILWVRSQIPG